MIIYLADRNLNILSMASTSLPDGVRIISDTKTEDIESGVKTFECEIGYDDYNRLIADKSTEPGNYLLRHTDGEDEFYSVVSADINTGNKTISIYAEDAGLDLLGTQVPAYEASEAQTLEWYVNYFCGVDSGWQVGENEASENSLTLKWDGESTLTERIQSIANSFGCEVSYSFEIERLEITAKIINFNIRRGNEQPVVQAKLGKEISNINIKKSTENLATAFKVTGGTPKNSSKAVTLIGHPYTTTINGDTYQVDTETGIMQNLDAMDRWSGVLDEDGLIVRQYSYDTTDKDRLASMSAVALSKCCDCEVNYEVEFIELDAKIGDTINVIDDKGELYLEARVLKLSRSEISGTVTATLGDYLIKSSGISDRLIELAKEAAKEAVNATIIDIVSNSGTQFHNTPISCTLTATVRYGDVVITTPEQLVDTFGSTAVLWWYNGDTPIGRDFTKTINSSNSSETIEARVEI